MKSLTTAFSLCLVTGCLFALSGCGESKPASSNSDSHTSADQDASHAHDGDHGHEGDHAHDGDGGHGHGAGPHDGTLADWGGGKYHVEFTVNHDKQEATVYVLGDDEKTAVPIKVEEIQLSIKPPEMQVNLKASPQEGDPEGSASRFTGNHKGLGIVMEYEGTMSGVIDGTPYSGNFKEEPHGEHAH